MIGGVTVWPTANRSRGKTSNNWAWSNSTISLQDLCETRGGGNGHIPDDFVDPYDGWTKPDFVKRAEEAERRKALMEKEGAKKKKPAPRRPSRDWYVNDTELTYQDPAAIYRQKILAEYHHLRANTQFLDKIGQLLKAQMAYDQITQKIATRMMFEDHDMQQRSKSSLDRNTQRLLRNKEDLLNHCCMVFSSEYVVQLRDGCKMKPIPLAGWLLSGAISRMVYLEKVLGVGV